MQLAMLAGTASTVIFAAANVPMVVKAIRTRDLSSYSLPSLAAANAGNVVHTAYVLSLPPGPIWVLHGFYLVAMLLMMVLYLRHARGRADDGDGHPAPDHGADEDRGVAQPGPGPRG